MISPVLGLDSSPSPNSTKTPEPSSSALCLHCGRPLSWMARFRGQSRFCSEKHRELYKLESDRLALEALHWNHGLQVKAQARPTSISRPDVSKTDLSRPDLSKLDPS